MQTILINVDNIQNANYLAGFLKNVKYVENISILDKAIETIKIEEIEDNDLLEKMLEAKKSGLANTKNVLKKLGIE